MDVTTTPSQSGTVSHVRFLRTKEVLERIGMSRAQLYRLIAAGKFPRPIKWGAHSALWPENEVSAVIAERLAARERAA